MITKVCKSSTFQQSSYDPFTLKRIFVHEEDCFVKNLAKREWPWALFQLYHSHGCLSWVSHATVHEQNTS